MRGHWPAPSVRSRRLKATAPADGCFPIALPPVSGSLCTLRQSARRRQGLWCSLGDDEVEIVRSRERGRHRMGHIRRPVRRHNVVPGRALAGHPGQSTVRAHARGKGAAEVLTKAKSSNKKRTL
eukprot:scaffold24196_cov120-Isochrysis_galbana.AAC.2